jgi:alpha,alpha-trehalase
VGAWLDYDLINNRPRNYFVGTNLSPLWTKCYHQNETKKIADKVLTYIEKLGLDSYPGGVPNTLYETGEQWDSPNVWPSIQHMLIVGLKNLGDERTDKLALKWAEKWVQSNHVAYKETNAMFEKVILKFWRLIWLEFHSIFIHSI